MAQNASGDDERVEDAEASPEGADEQAASLAEERAASEAADEFQSKSEPGAGDGGGEEPEPEPSEEMADTEDWAAAVDEAASDEEADAPYEDTFESHDQVIAEVDADTVNISGGGAQNVSARQVTISQGGAFLVQGREVKLEQSGAFAVVGDTVDISGDGSGIFIVIGRTVNGGRPVLDWRGAAAIVAAFLILRRVLGRRSRNS